MAPMNGIVIELLPGNDVLTWPRGRSGKARVAHKGLQSIAGSGELSALPVTRSLIQELRMDRNLTKKGSPFVFLFLSTTSSGTSRKTCFRIHGCLLYSCKSSQEKGLAGPIQSRSVAFYRLPGSCSSRQRQGWRGGTLLLAIGVAASASLSITM